MKPDPSSAVARSYLPAKYDPGVNLNGTVRREPTPDDEREYFMCDFLSWLAARLPTAPDWKMDGFFSAVADSEQAAKEMAAIDRPGLEKQSVHHFVPTREFGQYLASAFAALEREERSGATMVLHAAQHDLAIVLRRKNKNGVPVYVTRLIDPNRTKCLFRTPTTRVDALRSLTLRDLFGDNEAVSADYDIYFLPSTEVVAVDSLNLPAGAWDSRSTDLMEHPIAARTLIAAARHEGLDVIHRFNELSKDDRLTLLCMPDAEGLTAIHWALLNSTTSSFDALMGLMHDMDASERFTALTAEVQGFGPVFILCRYGNQALLAAYRDAVLALGPDFCTRALTCHRPNKPPLLVLAMNNRNPQKVGAFSTLIEGLPDTVKCAILACPWTWQAADGSGRTRPPVIAGARKGNHECLLKWWEMARQLPREWASRLLHAQDSEGLTAREHASNKGYTNVVTFLDQCAAQLLSRKRPSSPDAPAAKRTGRESPTPVA